MALAFGKRFQPTDEELIGHFLRNTILRQPLSPSESRVVIYKEMYGKEATPWELFHYEVDENNQLLLPWVTNVDPLGKIEADVRVLYVFTKLSKVGKTEKSSNKMKNRVAGCGSWHGNKTKEAVCGSDGTVIGYKRYFTFRSTPNRATVGQWNMVEYNMEGAEVEDFVLCRIRRNDSKASIGGRLVSTSASSATSMVGEASTHLSAKTKKKRKTEKFTKNSSSTSEDHGISKVVAAQEPSWAASVVDNTMNNSVFSSWGDQFQQQQQYLQPVMMMPAGVVHNQEPVNGGTEINTFLSSGQTHHQPAAGLSGETMDQLYEPQQEQYLQQLGRIVSSEESMPPLVDAEENVFNDKEFLDIGDDFFDVEGIIKYLNSNTTDDNVADQDPKHHHLFHDPTKTLSNYQLPSPANNHVEDTLKLKPPPPPPSRRWSKYDADFGFLLAKKK